MIEKFPFGCESKNFYFIFYFELFIVELYIINLIIDIKYYTYKRTL